MRDEASIKQKYHEQPGILSYMRTVIADLYGDAAKIKGRSNISDSLKQLRHLLNNYDYQQLRDFFGQI